MTSIPLIRQNFFSYCLSTLQYVNVSNDVIIERARLPHWEDGNANDAIPMEHVYRLLQTASQVTGVDRYGIMTVERHNVEDLAGFGKVLRGSISVYEVLCKASQLANKYSTTLRFWVEEADGGVWFCRRNLAVFPEFDAGMRQLEMLTMTVMVDFVRLGAGPDWQAERARMIASHPKQKPDWPALQNSDFTFDTRCTAIFVPDSVLPLSAGTVTAQTVRTASESEQFLRESWADVGLAASVREVLKSLLNSGDAKLEIVAEIAGVSTRTLQRRLNDEEAPFKVLRDQARFEKARSLLANDDFSLTEVSHELGYQNLSHFSRAFKRWAGVTPNRYRANLLKN